MLRVSVISIRAVRISGIETGDGITLKVLRGLARERQAEHAAMFGEERTSKGPLKFNSPAYTRRKMQEGKDRRRGHRDGYLQAALETRQLWEVKITRSKEGKGVGYITFSENRLIDIVPHYEWYRDGNDYHDGKTAGSAGVLIMTQAFAKRVQKELRALADSRAADRDAIRRQQDAIRYGTGTLRFAV